MCAVSLASVEGMVATRPELYAAQVLALNPLSLAAVLDDIERIGVAAGAAVAAREYAEGLRERVRRVVEMAAAEQASTPGRPRVAVIEWIEPLMAAGNWTPELVDLAGGDYGLAEAGRHSPYVEWRQIREFAPEVLLIAPCGFDLERGRREAGCLERLPGWAEVPAVARGRATVIDGDAYLNRPGPRLVDSLELLHRLIAAGD